jgi:hypothetical protein
LRSITSKKSAEIKNPPSKIENLSEVGKPGRISYVLFSPKNQSSVSSPSSSLIPHLLLPKYVKVCKVSLYINCVFPISEYSFAVITPYPRRVD